MIKVLMVGMGGFAGSICRFMVYEGARVFIKNQWLPLGTLAVNIFGCFLIGFLAGLSEARDIFTPEIRALVFIGFLGGFTTFSTFGFELFSMLRNGQITATIINIGLHLCMGILAVWLGFSVSRIFYPHTGI